MRKKNEEFGCGYIKFDKPILLPMVEWVAGCTRLEPGGEVCAGVLNLVLIRKQAVFEAMGIIVGECRGRLTLES